MSPTPITPLELSSKDKFKTIFSGFSLFGAIAVVLAVYTFAGEHSSQTVFIIWIVVDLILIGIMIWSAVVGYKEWKQLQGLLLTGALTSARCVDSKVYSLDDSQNPNYKLTYVFEVDGKKYSFTSTSVTKLRLPIPVFYDQNNPDNWLSLATLPDSVADRIAVHYGQRNSEQE